MDGNVLEFLQGIKYILIDNKFDEDVFESYLLDCVLEILVCKDYIIAIPVNEQNGFVLDLSMPSSNTGGFQKFLLASI